MTRMVDIAEGRLKRALERSESLEPERVSSKLTMTYKNNKTKSPSIVTIIPSDLIDDKDEYHQKTWRVELLKNGCLLFRPQ